MADAFSSSSLFKVGRLCLQSHGRLNVSPAVVPIVAFRIYADAKPPACFPSLARANGDELSKYRFLDPSSTSAQCLCFTPDSVPCTAAEVFESRKFSFSSVHGTACRFQDTDGASFDMKTPGSADSKLFIAAADSGKIYCPVSNSKNHKQQLYDGTYSKFSSADEMNDYCANGLPAQHELSSITPCRLIAKLILVSNCIEAW